MRRYILASAYNRDNVDLIDYRDEIIKAVHAVMPKAVVLVEDGCFYIRPTPSRSQSIQIGKRFHKTYLKQYSKMIGKIFLSTEVKKEGHKSEKKKSDKPKQSKYAGGHF